MYIYQCDLEMDDYLFYATTERGKVAETGPYVHNYALTYALSVLWEDKTNLPPRFQAKQQPSYKEELADLDFYLTPAQLLSGQQKIIQYNTINEGYNLSKGRNLGYPNWGYIKPFVPGSKFRFYALSNKELDFPRYIRLGKFMGKARLKASQAEQVTEKSGEFKVESLLNWKDLQETPQVFDILPQTLPTQLIENACYKAGDYYQAKLPAGKINFPQEMDYLCHR